jgi:Fic-DOC domain mobile mystery protein B
MGLNPGYSEGQTLLDEEERDGLLIPVVSTRFELNEFEQMNIEQAIEWTQSRSFTAETLFSQSFICMLHKRMFAEVWAWAGKFRKTEKNIGIPHWKIPTELKYLLDDVRFWYENDTYPPEGLALRFKHRLVSIHCFSNGNGRHSRLMADIILSKIYKKQVFSWGALQPADRDIRSVYLRAVKAADKGDFRLLIEFSGS